MNMYRHKFVVLCDMDDVLENLIKVWFEILDEIHKNNSKYVPVKYEDHDTWDIVPKYPMLTVDEIFHPLNMPEIWDKIRPLQGAVKAIKKINNDPRVELRILTATHYRAVVDKRKFLKKYFPFINWNQVIIAYDKQMINGDVLIDDRFDNHIGGNYQGLLFDQPWNRYIDEKPHGIIRVKNWDETEKILDKLITQKCGTVNEWISIYSKEKQ